MATAVTLDQRYTGPLVVESYLKKLKKSGHHAVFSSKFTKRWFVLDLRSGSFHYLKNKNKSKPEKAYTLSDILSVDINPKVIEICDWKFSFVVETNDRSYFLYAESVSMHTLWCTALLALVRVPLGQPQQTSDRPAYEHYQDYGNSGQDPAKGDPRQQGYDPQARTPSPVQDSRYPAYPPPQYEGQSPERQPGEEEQGTDQHSQPAASMEQPQEPPPQEPPSIEPPRQPEPPQSRRQVPQAPPAPQAPEGTFVRVMEEAPQQSVSRPRPAESQRPAEQDEFEVHTPSRFSEGKKGGVAGESSYKPEGYGRSIWAEKSEETDGVIKVEKLVPEVTAKEEVRNIRRERLVKKEDKPKEQPRPAPKVEEKPKPKPQPEAPSATAIKESLNLGKGGFTDILDEMHNLSLPPADEGPGSIWGGGKQIKEKKPKEQPAVTGYQPARTSAPPVYEPAPAYRPAYEQPVTRPAYDSGYRQDPRPPPTYQEAPPRSAYDSGYRQQPPAYQEAPRSTYEPEPQYRPQPPAYQEAPRPAYEPEPQYRPQPVYEEAPRSAYDSGSRQEYRPQPPVYQEAPRSAYDSGSQYRPQPAYEEAPRSTGYRQESRPQGYQEVPSLRNEAPRAAYQPPAAYLQKPIASREPGRYIGTA